MKGLMDTIVGNISAEIVGVYPSAQRFSSQEKAKVAVLLKCLTLPLAPF
jgi:hypothetical protein